MKGKAAIVGIGQSELRRLLPVGQLGLGAKKLQAALAGAQLERKKSGGLALGMG